MFILTYDSLVTLLVKWTKRTDQQFISAIPSFITFAQDMICNDLEIRGMQNIVTGNFIANSNVIVKPSQWRGPISFTMIDADGTMRPLQLRTLEYCRTYSPGTGDASVSGVPLYYADYDYSHWYIAPTPDATYNFEIAYSVLANPLDENYQVNWLTSYAPSVLFFAVLWVSSYFCEDANGIQAYQALYENALQKLIAKDSGNKIDRFGNPLKD